LGCCRGDRRGGRRCGAGWAGAGRRDGAWPGAKWCCAGRRGGVRWGPARSGTRWRGTPWRGRSWRGIPQAGVPWRGEAWRGGAWPRRRGSSPRYPGPRPFGGCRRGPSVPRSGQSSFIQCSPLACGTPPSAGSCP